VILREFSRKKFSVILFTAIVVCRSMDAMERETRREGGMDGWMDGEKGSEGER
jgi:hypothetical protein